MSKKKYTYDYWSRDRISKFDATYHVVFGERGPGKTYDIKKLLIDRAKEGYKFIYMRRVHKYIVRQKMQEVFSDLDTYAEDVLGDIMRYSIADGFYYTNENGAVERTGWAVSVEDSFEYKGVPFTNVKTIMFDEFIDYDYMRDEIPRFLNLISTICREYPGIEIWMLGNTVSKFCPYFNLLGIKPERMKQGDIAYITHKRGVKVAAEYTRTRLSKEAENVGQKTNEYTGFDSDEANMILFGEWDSLVLNVSNIDGIGWSDKRRQLIPVYFTGAGHVFEVSIVPSQNPIAFVRTVNTQHGIVRKAIKYNFSATGQTLQYSNGTPVPIYTRIPKRFIEQNILNSLDVFFDAIDCGRVVYNNMVDGTDFLTLTKEMR